MVRSTHCIIAIALVALLCACAPVRIHETPDALHAQTDREAALASKTQWFIHARIAVSNGKDGGSGDLEWRQSPERYSFVVRAPVTGKTWKLTGDSRMATLEGVEQQPMTDASAERLLRDRVGWDVPLVDMNSWVLGTRAPGKTTQLLYDDRNLPAVLEQDGWKVEYRDWFTDRTPPLPRKVFASRGSASVRVVIEQWSFNE
jgi:outer membrane lipoprotein LolB